MFQFSHITEAQSICNTLRQQGNRIAFVPTMGFLHEGHLSLMRKAREIADKVVVSIFVNAKQFGPQEDLEKYPQDLQSDLEKCRNEGVEVVFTPHHSEMYPADFQTAVEVQHISRGLCGEKRPGHFCGVTTVVSKLFNIIGPCRAVFGKKDFQQLLVIQQMVKDLCFPVEVYACPIIREKDGLALSSRNAYLSVQERLSATCLYRALREVEQQVQKKDGLPADKALRLAKDVLLSEASTRIDYVEFRNPHTLEPLEILKPNNSLMALAIYLGKTRLIDNMVF